MPLIEVHTATGFTRHPRRSLNRSSSYSRSRSRSRSRFTTPHSRNHSLNRNHNHNHSRRRSSSRPVVRRPSLLRRRRTQSKSHTATASTNCPFLRARGLRTDTGTRPSPPSTKPPSSPPKSSTSASHSPQLHSSRPHHISSFCFRPRQFLSSPGTMSEQSSPLNSSTPPPQPPSTQPTPPPTTPPPTTPPPHLPSRYKSTLRRRVSLVRSLSISSIGSSLGVGARVPPIDDDTPTVSVAIPLSDLRGAIDNGLRKKSATILHRFMKRRVSVEASVDGVKDFVFYAPEGDAGNRRATPTEFVKVRPLSGDPTIVRRTDNFEISFVGLSVIPEDTIFNDKNELLLYSLKTSPGAVRDVDDDAEKLHDNDSDDLDSMLTDIEAPISATSGFSLSPDDVPFIHFDPVVDGHDVGSKPNSFVPIPASKCLFLQHYGAGGKHKKPSHGLASVSLRFNVLEIDSVSDGQARAVGSIGEMGKTVKSTGVPYLQPLSMAANAAAAMGRQALKNYSKPDHVLSKDLLYLLAEPEEEDNNKMNQSATSGNTSSNANNNRVETYGNFLRYGYYFFLGQKVDAKLYAQTGSSSQTVPLLLRRHPFTKDMALRDEKEFFPLTGVSYVCVKVSAGCTRKYERDVRRMEKEHRRRLENMLQMSDAMEMLANVQKE